jgi:hypothetical protein
MSSQDTAVMSRQTPQHKGFARPIVATLENALAISQRYGIQLRSEHPANQRSLSSLGSLAAHIAAQRGDTGSAS